MVAVSAASSVASDMMLAAREQADGRKYTYETTITVPVGETVSQATEIQMRLSASLGKNGVAVVGISNSPNWNSLGNQTLHLPGQPLTIEWDAGDVRGIRRLPVISGTYAQASDPYPPRLTLNQAAATVIGYPRNRVVLIAVDADGPWVTFGVDAVIADGGSDPAAYASIASLPLLGDAASESTLRIRVSSPVTSQKGVHQLLSDVLSDVGVQGDPDVYRTDTTWQVEDQVRTIRIIFSGFSVLMLTIAAIGILNVGLSSVRERSRELVVRRALGARRIDVFSLVMATETLIALIVAFLSICLALVGVYWLVPKWIPLSSAITRPSFPWKACLIGIIAAVVTAMVGSASPAWKASRLPIAQALRQ